MNRAVVDRIADAVLYEGYILYPYRPSLKNHQRWTFGGLLPRAWCQAQATGDAGSNQTECLVRGNPQTKLEVIVRFLHLTDRMVGKIVSPLSEWTESAEPDWRAVESLQVGGRILQAWQEAQPREVAIGPVSVAELSTQPQSTSFAFAGSRHLEPVRGPDGMVEALLIRHQQPITGMIETRAVEVAPGLYRLTIRVENRTPNEGSTREGALRQALVSTHAILGVLEGEFLSLLDPPEDCREAAAGCTNQGTYPVLVGEEGQKDTMLSSPIILYDHPQVAPESPGDFFDGTEIDEMLALRIMTMTDAEKVAMASVDERARALLARTETLGQDQLLALHGTVRGLRPAEEPNR
jgi:hypothetical protein